MGALEELRGTGAVGRVPVGNCQYLTRSTLHYGKQGQKMSEREQLMSVVHL
jgi:hypothetical protein